VALRAFPPLSQRCALQAGGRSRRTQAKRRLGRLAALARRPLRGGPGLGSACFMRSAMNQ